LAGSQSDFVRNHINIIPAPVKDIFEKSSDEVPDRTAMKLYRSYHTVISCKHSIAFTLLRIKRMNFWVF